MAKYGVYIIESLRSSDFYDGENLSQILEISDIQNTYVWVDTKSDFRQELMNFQKSKFRYLHLSFHGDRKGLEINGESISNKELCVLLKPSIRGKRLFISSCKGSNINLASKLITKCKCRSLIGTPIDLPFDKAALFWPAFYHVINDLDSNKMDQKNIRKTLKQCVDIFRIPINYYHSLREYPPNYLLRLTIRPNKWTRSKIVKVVKRRRKISRFKQQ